MLYDLPVYGLRRLSNTAQGEKFSDTKKRLEKLTGIKGKNFEKIKFAVVKRNAFSKPTYLNDGMQPVPSCRDTRLHL